MSFWRNAQQCINLSVVLFTWEARVFSSNERAEQVAGVVFLTADFSSARIAPRQPVEGRSEGLGGESFQGIFPDQLAPIVRNSADGERELVMARWGMPGPPQFGGQPVTNIRNVASPHWRG
jgi:putative SOS response-associated peptidase YedK